MLIVDIEGAEAIIADAMASSSAHKIILELHPGAIGLDQCQEVAQRLYEAGFRVLEPACDGQVLCFTRGDDSGPSHFIDTSAFLVLRALTSLGSPVNAADGLWAAADRCYENPSIHRRLARVLLQGDELGGAADQAQKAIEIAPTQFESFVLLAQVERRRSNLDTAQALITKALEFADKIVAVWQEQLELESARGDRLAAFQTVSRIVELNPLHGRAWYRRARLAHALGDADAATQSIAKAIELRPADRDVAQLESAIHKKFAR